MKNSPLGPFSQIRADLALLVKALVLSCVVLASAPAAAEEEEPSPPSEAASDEQAPSAKSDPAEAKELPPIQARAFQVKIRRRSNSNRVYMVHDASSEGESQVGRILLFKDGKKHVMAFRVLKTYPDKRELAVKRVRTYPKQPEILRLGDQFLAVEKLADLGDVPPPTLQDQRDLKELETPVGAPQTAAMDPGLDGPAAAPGAKAALDEEADLDIDDYDSDLDRGSSPPPLGDVNRGLSEDDGSEPFDPDNVDDDIVLSTDDVQLIDTDRHTLGAEYGKFRNSALGDSLPFYDGAGIRYGYTFGQMVFLRKPALQDTVTLEAGLYYYKIIATTTALSVLPIIGNIRYNLHFHDTFTLFVYGGMMRNNILSTVNAEEMNADTLASLSNPLPSGGVGTIFRIGPNWDLRITAGIDMLGAGLMLRF